MIPKYIVYKINEALPICPYNTSGMSVYMDWVVYKENILKQRKLVMDGYTLAQQSIQDEAIAFAKWIQNKGYFASTTVSNLWISKDYFDFTTEQLYTKFKTEQDERN